MIKPVITFENVTKMYRLGDTIPSLRSSLLNIRRLVNSKKSEDPPSLKALNNISLEIGHGESVGFIGPNGSGKTTTLKLISNITRCNSGRVSVLGKISALIELGAGFHPDLTGRENIYFNAAILGMRKADIERRFDAIVSFSGLEQFLDTPVKRYSSGMYCRLGFAVAAYVNPDVLLVDEVLAVGDQSFQNRCLKRMSDLREDGTTIIFVTHNLGYLQRLCNRVIFLYKGEIVEDGNVNDVIRTYRDHFSYSDTCPGASTGCEPAVDENSIIGEGAYSGIKITDVYITDPQQERIDQVQTGSDLSINIAYKAYEPFDAVNFEVWIYGLDGTEYATFSTQWQEENPITVEKDGVIQLKIENLCLMPGSYFLNAAISDKNGLKKYDMHWDRHRLVVLSGPITHGLIFQPHKWVLR